MEDFATRLSRLMKKKNYNNSSMGRELGYKSNSTVQKWTKGLGMPELKKINQIADLLEVSPSYLLHGVEEQNRYSQNTDNNSQLLEEPLTTYGITKDELIEFYKWKANKATEEAETATKQVERLKSTSVDAN